MIRLAPALLLTVCLSPALRGEELTPAKAADIRRLMEVTGSADLALQFASATSRQMFQVIKAAQPDFPDRAIAILEKELLALFAERMAAPGGLVDQVIPIYARHFSHAEIRELLAFYDTPIGRKTVRVLPTVVAESMAAGQQWGQSLGPDIQKRLLAALKREGLLPEKT